MHKDTEWTGQAGLPSGEAKNSCSSVPKHRRAVNKCSYLASMLKEFTVEKIKDKTRQEKT